MITATYHGKADQGRVDGVVFPRGVPTEVDDSLLDRLKELDDYDVEMPEAARKFNPFGDDADDNEEVTHGDGSV